MIIIVVYEFPRATIAIERLRWSRPTVLMGYTVHSGASFSQSQAFQC